MKIGDTKIVRGVTIKMVKGNKGCYSCDLRTRDKEYLNISQRRDLDLICAAMPIDCRDIDADYKIDGPNRLLESIRLTQAEFARNGGFSCQGSIA